MAENQNTSEIQHLQQQLIRERRKHAKAVDELKELRQHHNEAIQIVIQFRDECQKRHQELQKIRSEYTRLFRQGLPSSTEAVYDLRATITKPSAN